MIIKSVGQKGVYTADIIIPCYDTDAAFYLKPASFMDFAQELAYYASNDLGFGYNQLKEHNTAWVLSRVHIEFLNMPVWKEQVSLDTWHKGLDGLFFLRDFKMKNQKNEVLINCTTSWLVIDTASRRLVRSTELVDFIPSNTPNSEQAIEAPCPKIIIPKDAEMEYAGVHRVSYSDVDIIGHTNNTRYIVWAMDCIDYEVVSQMRVKDIKINFNKESLAGESVELYKTIKEEDNSKVYYIEGREQSKSVFCAEIAFRS